MFRERGDELELLVEMQTRVLGELRRSPQCCCLPSSRQGLLVRRGQRDGSRYEPAPHIGIPTNIRHTDAPQPVGSVGAELPAHQVRVSHGGVVGPSNLGHGPNRARRIPGPRRLHPGAGKKGHLGLLRFVGNDTLIWPRVGRE